jgi:AhpC/TSA family
MSIDAVSLTDPEGRTVRVNLRGDIRPMVIYVYRPTCGWCRKNLDNIKELTRQLAETNRVELIGMSLERDGLLDYLHRSELRFPSYTSIPAEFSEKYHLGDTPETILIKNGKIVNDWHGAYSDALKHDVESTLNVSLPGLAR